MSDNAFADFYKQQSSGPPNKSDKAGGASKKKKRQNDNPQQTILTSDDSAKPIGTNTTRSFAEEIKWRSELTLEIDNEKRIQKMREIAKAANKNGIKLTQIRQLENTAFSARSWSEILDFIYRQISKDRYWKEWGEELKKELQDLIEHSKEICKSYWDSGSLSDRLKIQESTLILMRGTISHLSALFAYEHKARQVRHKDPQGAEKGRL